MEPESKADPQLLVEHQDEIQKSNVATKDTTEANLGTVPRKTQRDSILKRLGAKLGFQQFSPAAARGSPIPSAVSSETSGLSESSVTPSVKSLSPSESNQSLEITNTKKISSKQSLLKKLSAALLPLATVADDEIDIDRIIADLKASVNNTGNSLCVKPKQIKMICRLAREITMSQPMLLNLNSPIYICGDIHGQFSDLLRIFEKCGDPSKSNFLFLGDYVDRGKKSLETILLMQCYKIKYPESFFLLRGNHETSSVNRFYGFYDECKRRCNSKIWKNFTDYFNVLPLAAVIGDRVFCVHGGLSPHLNAMEDISEIQRPLPLEESMGLAVDLLWSDPDADTEFWEMNDDRGVSYIFGYNQVDKFLSNFDFNLIVRAHMIVQDGYEFFHGRKLVTLFTAPNYCGQFDNRGAIMEIDENLKCSFHILEPTLLSSKVAEIIEGGPVDEKKDTQTDSLQIEKPVDELTAKLAKDVFVPTIVVDEDSPHDSTDSLPDLSSPSS